MNSPGDLVHGALAPIIFLAVVADSFPNSPHHHFLITLVEGDKYLFGVSEIFGSTSMHCCNTGNEHCQLAQQGRRTLQHKVPCVEYISPAEICSSPQQCLFTHVAAATYKKKSVILGGGSWPECKPVWRKKMQENRQ